MFLTDQFGNVLSEDVSKNSSDMQSYRTAFEKEAARKIKDTLETIMGKDNVSVQVSTVMDFNQTRATIESYTPNKNSDSGIVVSRQGEKEIYSNPQMLPSNKAQAQNQAAETTEAQQRAQEQIDDLNRQINQDNQQNTAEQNTAQNTIQNAAELPLNQTPAKTTNYTDSENAKADDVRKLSYEKEKSATTYAVTKEIKQIVYAPGAVTRMSVAVAVNKVLTEAEKEEIKNLVIAACGMDTLRGDVVSVSSLKFTGIDNSEELKQSQKEKQEFILEILTFIFKNVSPVFIILILGLVALHNFGNIFKSPEPEIEEEEIEEEATPLPSFDPYLALQSNKTNDEDFYQQDIQYTSAVDKKKSEIINSILGNPEEAARILTSYIKE